jgi:ATP-dependent DNA ligase
VGLVLQVPVGDLESLEGFEDVVLRQGYEGIMPRRPNSLYKQGRVTLAENSLLRRRRPQHRHNH